MSTYQRLVHYLMNKPLPSEKQQEKSPSRHAVLEIEDLLFLIFDFVDFPTLIRVQQVCSYWRTVVHITIPRVIGCKKFTTTEELIEMIKKYCSKKSRFADELARTYGWPIGRWDVSLITNFQGAFEYQTDFNEDISEWDMSNATKLECMFWRARSFNQDLSKWNTSQVVNMAHMFRHAMSFNGNISTWNTSRVKTMSYMFFGTKSFNQNISVWNVKNVGNHNQSMFVGAVAFNKHHAPSFDET